MTENTKTKKCESCEYKDQLIEEYRKRLKLNKAVIHVLTKENLSLKVEKHRKDKNCKPFSHKYIKTDKKMNFYTGLQSIKLFETLYKLLSPYVTQINYWRGQKRVISTRIKRQTFAKSTKKKITPKDELLLTLMRLRLGCLNEDLADQFCISPTICSNIFKTWMSFLAQTVGKLVTWLPKENILENLPKVYRDAGHHQLRCIIDCSEVFIERPKSLENQAVTWSDYKSHNTIKFLIGISPTGFVTFISDCYGGRASDKFICNDSGFFDNLDPYDEIMADRGFQIQEELIMNFCKLSVPPGARVKAQLTKKETNKTKDIANLRIHVERAINRIKTYRILKNIFPISMLHSVDDIVKVCGGLCNLKPLLFQKSVNIT